MLKNVAATLPQDSDTLFRLFFAWIHEALGGPLHNYGQGNQIYKYYTITSTVTL